jgi:tetratricopeptide (TPR) repeat protein
MMNAYSRLAEAYDRRKDYNHCVIALQKIALADLSDAGAAAATAFAYDKLGKKSAAAYWRSVAAAAREDYTAQLKYAGEAKQDPEWKRRARAAEAAAYRGMNRMKDYVAAMQDVTAAATAEDDVTMAGAYGSADMPDDQIRLLKRALTKNPKNAASIYKQLSDVADKQGLRDQAEAYIQEAIKLKPSSVSYHATLGEFYMERRSEGGRLDKAIDEFKTVMKLDRYEVIGYQRIGIAYAAKGDLRRAARNLEHALDLLPGDGATYQELGRVYAKMGNKAGSDRMFELYHKYVDFDLKQKTLATQSRARKTDPTAQKAMGEFLEQSGNYSDAMQYYRQALTLQPGSTEIKAKIKKLEGLLGQAPE